MTDQGPSNRRGLPHLDPATRKGILWACFFALVVGVMVWTFKHFARPYATSKHPPPLDPTTVIATFITLYGLFIGGFGVLIGFVAKKKVKNIGRLTAWKAAAITFLILGVGVDLWRVLDSTNDLFKAATYGLDYSYLKDDITDFTWYFFINVFVIMFSIGVAVWPTAELAHREADHHV